MVNKRQNPHRKPPRRIVKDSGSDNRTERKQKLPLSKAINPAGPVRLNKYIASSGVCSRRDADELISGGKIKVNGETVTTLGYKVNPGDKVLFENRELNPQHLVYILLNKPKDFITTTDDPQNRNTVMDLVKSATNDRVFPVGRLDRLTTGLILLTNDGDLAKRLSHPSHQIRKIYHVTLDKALTNKDLLTIQEGITLDDGPVSVNEIIVLSNDRKEIGLEIHIGRNRIVRRIFEHLNYKIRKLDRVSFAGLTKKDIPRGKWRFLTAKEIVRLKHF